MHVRKLLFIHSEKLSRKYLSIVRNVFKEVLFHGEKVKKNILILGEKLSKRTCSW